MKVLVAEFTLLGFTLLAREPYARFQIPNTWPAAREQTSNDCILYPGDDSVYVEWIGGGGFIGGDSYEVSDKLKEQ